MLSFCLFSFAAIEWESQAFLPSKSIRFSVRAAEKLERLSTARPGRVEGGQARAEGSGFVERERASKIRDPRSDSSLSCTPPLSLFPCNPDIQSVQKREPRLFVHSRETDGSTSSPKPRKASMKRTGWKRKEMTREKRNRESQTERWGVSKYS